MNLKLFGKRKAASLQPLDCEIAPMRHELEENEEKRACGTNCPDQVMVTWCVQMVPKLTVCTVVLKIKCFPEGSVVVDENKYTAILLSS